MRHWVNAMFALPLRQWRILFFIFLLITLLPKAGPVAAEGEVVRCILFYSPTCPHCHTVISETLIPLMEEYGEQLDLVAINTAHQQGQAFYQSALETLQIPAQRRGVPTLIVGDVVLVGSGEIPQQLPGLIDRYLAEGGVDWPAIPGLVAVMDQETAPTPVPTTAPAPPGPVVESEIGPVVDVEAAPAPAGSDGVGDLQSVTGSASESGILAAAADRFRQDTVGNTLSVVVLLGMVTAVIFALARFAQRETFDSPSSWRRWGVAALIVLGLGVSLYMAYVETSQNLAVCGPVGDCNTVQQSEYARLFGVLPIGVLGVVGYSALGGFWALAQWGDVVWRARGARLLAAAALAGTGFSIYLTFLEPFVIGATCMWCLTSAVAMTSIALLSAGTATVAVRSETWLEAPGA